MSSYFRQQLEDWLKIIEVNTDSVLDIGGSANPIKERVKSWDVHSYYLLDNMNENGLHEKWTDPGIRWDMNIPIDDTLYTYQERFDIVFCLEVSEYIYDPVTFIENIYKFLKRGGIGYLSFPSIYPVHNPVETDYLRYTRNAIERLCIKFEKVEITSRVATAGKENLRDFYRNEKMHPVKSDVVYDIGYLVKLTK